MSSAVEILPFAAGHAEGVPALIVPIQQREFGIPITLDAQPDLLDIDGYYRRGAGDFWVAVEGGCVVGSIALLDIGSGQGALRKMFVAPSHRGPQAGVAARLLATLLDHGRAAGIREIFLGTTEQFRAAQRFYEKSGFTPIDRSLLPAAFPVMQVDTKFYRLGL